MQSLGGDVRLLGMHFLNNTTGYVAGSLGRVYKTIDGGGTRQPESISTTVNIYAIAFPTSADTGFASSDMSLVHKTVDGGAT